MGRYHGLAAILGLVVLSGFEGTVLSEAAERKSPRLFVFDSAGKVVGPLVANGSFATNSFDSVLLRIPADGPYSRIAVSPSGFGPYGADYTIGLYYTTPNCKGQAYFYNDFSLVKDAVIDPHYTDASGQSEIAYAGPAVGMVQVQSIRSLAALRCEAARPIPAIMVKHIPVKALGFTPPFTIKEQKAQ